MSVLEQPTEIFTDPTLTGSTGQLSERPALAVIWSAEEDHRLGELVIPPRYGREEWYLGRHLPSGQDDGFLPFVRQRPGSLLDTGHLSSPRISRKQLAFSWDEEGQLWVENHGQCPMLIDGQPTKRTVLQAGMILELKRQLMFLCVLRTAEMSPWESFLPVPAFPFGEPDANAMTGESPAVWQLRREIRLRARGASRPVLIQGESGAGKELVAQSLHACSPRARKSLISRNAAAMPETLIEAELFGHARDFPNKGMAELQGLIEAADGSTFFLDEIGDMPQSLQARLLRVLDRQGEFQRLGESKVRTSNFWPLAATNRPDSYLKGDFRSRFVETIHVPGLNERREDIPLLIRQLLARLLAEEPWLGRPSPQGGQPMPPKVSSALVSALVQHTYAFHMRELEGLLGLAWRQPRGEELELTEGVKARLAKARDELARRQEAEPPQVPAESTQAATPPPQPATPSGESASLNAFWASRDALAFTGEELRRLELLRKHGFNPAACGADQAYKANRQKADLHLRQLISKALVASSFQPEVAIQQLAGSADPAQVVHLEERLRTWLNTLEGRVNQARVTPVQYDKLLNSVKNEYKAYAPLVQKILERLARMSPSSPSESVRPESVRPESVRPESIRPESAPAEPATPALSSRTSGV